MRVTKIGNKNWEFKASKLIHIKGKIWELAKLRVVRNIEWENNSKIYLFLEPNFDFFKLEKDSMNLLIFQFRKFSKFVDFPIWISTIPQILQFRK